ncbi:MAG: polysaccharide export protein [Deltaproteobacteria bacterium]|nr:polysaccharide export protein [Deltaproteobacteria bacterium]
MESRRFKLACCAILLCLAPACWWNSPHATPEVAKPRYVPASTLGPGDVFEVKVYDEKELSGIYRVSSAGSIQFPLIGMIDLNGLTSSDAAVKIRDKLAEKYLRNPQVSIFIREYNSKKISVFGQVTKPGTFQYEDGLTVIQAVSMAGGFTKMAAKNDTNVTRIVDGAEKRFSIPVEAIAQSRAKNFYLEPGDIVYVPESIW